MYSMKEIFREFVVMKKKLFANWHEYVGQKYVIIKFKIPLSQNPPFNAILLSKALNVLSILLSTSSLD